MREFKLATGWKVFSFVIFPVLMALIAWMGIYPFTQNPVNINQAYILVPLSVVLEVFFILGLVDAIKMRLTIYEDRIVGEGALYKRELPDTEVKGFKILTNNKIVIEPIESTTKKKIEISSYIRHSDELIAILCERYKDLDAVEYQKQEEELNKNIEEGETDTDHQHRIKIARKISNYLNYAAIAVALWYFLKPEPYELVTILNIIIPFVAFAVAYKYQGIVKIISTDKKSPYPNVSSALGMPVAAILIRVLLDFELYEYQHLWIPVALAGALLSFLFIHFVGKELNSSKKSELILNYTFSVVLIFLFVAFSYISVNCTFDRSQATIFKTKILNKSVTNGKHTTYNLTVDKWGKELTSSEMTVTKSQYEAMNTGDSVNIYLKSGRLNIPWIFVDKY